MLCSRIWLILTPPKIILSAKFQPLIFARSTLLAILLLLGGGVVTHAAETPGGNGSATAENDAPVAENAPPDSTIIDAQRLEIYLDREMRAFGDAEIRRNDQMISGDRIDYNIINHEIHATGNVHLKQGDDTADGPELRLKMDDREGEMTNPIFHLKNGDELKGRGSASTILFEGPIKELLKNVAYTTCEDGRDDWYMTADEMEVDHHSETATATQARINLMGVPIFYTPWMDFPLGTARKSGFLTPNAGVTSTSGWEFSLPYYWNIAPNMDATLTARYIFERGLQLQGEYRYLEPDYYGKDVVQYLPDDNETGRDRYYANLVHTQNFGDGWSAGVHFERVSDDKYFSDLSSHVVITSAVNLQEEAFLRYDKKDWHFFAQAQQYQTLDGASYVYQRMPQLTLNGLEELGPVDANLYSELVRFDKDIQAPPNVIGTRFTLAPSISLPMSRSYGYITPKIGIHYTGYELNNTGNTFDDRYSRTLPIFSLDSGLFFDRTMRVISNSYTQTLEPRLFYVYIPYKDQSRLPNFDTSLSDLNLGSIFAENQFVGGDRINNANQVTLALTSRLIDQKDGTQRLSATVGERIYFSDPAVNACALNSLPTDAVCTSSQPAGSHSDLLTAISLNLLNHWSADANWEYSTEIERTIKGNLSTHYRPEAGEVLNLAYRFTRDSLEQIDASAEWPLGGKWRGLGRLNYSLRNNPATNDVRGPIEYLGGLEYDAGCWLGRITMHRVPTATGGPNYTMFMQIVLEGFGQIGSGNSEILSRNIPGYTSSDKIPDSLQ